jgi:hypothetical protein
MSLRSPAATEFCGRVDSFLAVVHWVVWVCSFVCRATSPPGRVGIPVVLPCNAVRG